MINPAKLLKLKSDWDGFQERHPKFVKFLITAVQNGIPEGSIIEVKLTLPDGKEMESNMRLTQEDIDFIKGFQDIS